MSKQPQNLTADLMPSHLESSNLKPLTSTERLIGSPSGLTNHEQQALAQYIQAGTADNTRRAYQSSLTHFVRWGGQLPATVIAITQYLLAHAATHAHQTLSLRLSALSQWHRLQGFEDPCRHSSVRKVLTGIQRKHIRTPNKAKAITLGQLKQATACLGSQGAFGLRNTSLLLIGFYGALRRSELAQLHWQQIAWHDRGILLTLPKSKTDQEGKQITKAIPYAHSSLHCPVRHLLKWHDYLTDQRAVSDRSPVFPKIDRWGNLGSKPLTDHGINQIIKNIAIGCGWPDPQQYSGHSLRRGFSTSASQAGASFSTIKRQGGWSHDGTVQGYIDEGNLFEENAALVLLNQDG